MPSLSTINPANMGFMNWFKLQKAKRTERRLLRDRIIFVGLPIDLGVATYVGTKLTELASADSRPISLFVNSPGGSVEAGMKILRIMDQLSVEIHTYCIGQAQAMAAMLVAHGTRGYRHSVPEGIFSISSLWGKDADPGELERLQTITDEVLSKDTGLAIPEIRQLRERTGTTFRADQAVRFGLIDSVINDLSPTPSPQQQT